MDQTGQRTSSHLHPQTHGANHPFIFSAARHCCMKLHIEICGAFAWT